MRTTLTGLLSRVRASAVLVAASGSGRIPVHAIRVGLLRMLGASIDRGAVLYHGYQIRSPRKLSIGNDSCIGERAVLDARGGLTIGRSVNLSSGVQIWTAQHDWRSPTFDAHTNSVTIGDHVWIGPRVTVLPGAAIGDGVVIAAGAVVRGTCEPWGLYAGVPARRIGERPKDLGYRIGGARQKIWWW